MQQEKYSATGPEIDPRAILEFFYPEDTPFRRMLLKHSEQVRAKALALLRRSSLPLSEKIVSNGAMLHDIGIGRCDAPDIFCHGTWPYLKHGILGAELLHEYGNAHHLDLEIYARICERHIGSGITAEDIRHQNLPLPERDFLPETPEEKLICLADKFFSKSGDMKEKSLDRVRKSMQKFGEGSVARFEALYQTFCG